MSGWGLGGVVALGAFHGLNPAMGWLFAVSIGLQEQSRRALFSALPPIAAGHLAAVGVAVGAAAGLGDVLSTRTLRIGAAAALGLFAVWRLTTPHVHPRWVGMRLRPRELALWSFLMSSAHGAGLMLFPFVVWAHAHAMTAPAAIAGVHTLAMIAVAGGCAVAVYEFAGVGVLRRRWLNVDRVWAYALAGGAVVAFFVA